MPQGAISMFVPITHIPYVVARHSPDHNSAVEWTAHRLPPPLPLPIRRGVHRNVQLRELRLEHRVEQRREHLREQRLVRLREQLAEQRRIELKIEVEVQLKIRRKTQLSTQANTRRTKRPPVLRKEPRGVLRETRPRAAQSPDQRYRRFQRPCADSAAKRLARGEGARSQVESRNDKDLSR